MFDKDFEEPNYDLGGDYDGQGYSGDEYGSKSRLPIDLSDSKKLIKFGIIGIVILIIIFFAFNYISNQQTVTFNIQEKDGGPVTNERLIIYDSAKNPIYNESGATHTITLPPGVYTYKVNSLFYKPYEETIEISGGGTRSEPVSLYKDIDVEMNVVLPTSQIYSGQTINGTLEITNDGSSPIQNGKILFDSSVFDVEFVSDIVNVNPGQVTGIDFSIKVKEDEEISKESDEEVEFRLKGGRDKKSIDLTVLPSVELKDIDFSEDIIEEDKLTAGESELIDDITIENKNRSIPLKDVLVEIIPNPNSENKLNWFEFGSYTNQKYQKLIPNINPKEEASFSLNIKPPFSEEIESEFRGIMKISSLSMKEDIEIEVILKVSKKDEAKLELNTKGYSTKCIAGSGSCDEIVTIGTKATTLKNSGDVAINNINIELVEGGKASDYCSLWITLKETNIGTLNAGQDEVIAWDIVPTDDSGVTTHACYLKWTYTDPFNTSQTKTGESDPIPITVTVEEP